ncbi:MAG TPA: hypothetical protein VFQ44_13495 [Streptosporangiaceae bacterium]|nr:hypothetical protein [Streptosporangiaceae bacterium]
MASAVPMARSRGSLSGLALVLLGAWGGLAPFIGPYFRFGFAPDKAWVYNTSRLYLSLIPGAVVLLTGLIVLFTRSRWFGGLCAVVAALGGAWFVIGQAALAAATGSASTYSPGSPLGTTLARTNLDNVGSFAGVGVLIVFSAALALGRLSIAAHRDHERFGELGDAGAPGGLANVGLSPSSSVFDPYQPAQAPPNPPTGPQPVVGGDTRFPSQYPADPFSPEQAGYPGGNNPGTVTYSPGQTRYPPVNETTTSMTTPTEEQQFPPGP